MSRSDLGTTREPYITGTPALTKIRKRSREYQQRKARLRTFLAAIRKAQ